MATHSTGQWNGADSLGRVCTCQYWKDCPDCTRGAQDGAQLLGATWLKMAGMQQLPGLATITSSFVVQPCIDPSTIPIDPIEHTFAREL